MVVSELFLQVYVSSLLTPIEKQKKNTILKKSKRNAFSRKMSESAKYLKNTSYEEKANSLVPKGK